MKEKELKNLAKKIAVIEHKLQNTEDKEEQKQLQEAIINLSKKIGNLDDVFRLDELIQIFLSKMN